MSKRTRYLLLVLGFVFFVLFTPVMILYVTGQKYDIETGELVKTGILAIRSNPSSVNVFINGKLAKKSDGDIKFVAAGEYNVSVEKTGYQPWSKRFVVGANQVTWASPVPNNLFLFKQNTSPNQIAINAYDMTLSGDNLLYLSQSGLNLTSISDFSHSQTFALKNSATTITPSPNAEYFALDNHSLFNLNDKKIIDLSGVVTASSTLQFADDNSLYGLENNSIYKIDYNNLKQNQVIKNASAFSIVLENIYYLEKTATSSALYIKPVVSDRSQLLLDNLPTFNKAEIFVNFQKQVMLLLDDKVYQAANIPVLVANSVSQAKFDQTGSSLLILRNGELDFYNYSSQSLSFITRSALPITNFVFRPDIGYTFYFKDSSLQALELDLRDKQNQYTFYQATMPKKFLLDNEGKNLYILDDGKLFSQTIR